MMEKISIPEMVAKVSNDLKVELSEDQFNELVDNLEDGKVYGEAHIEQMVLHYHPTLKKIEAKANIKAVETYFESDPLSKKPEECLKVFCAIKKWMTEKTPDLPFPLPSDFNERFFSIEKFCFEILNKARENKNMMIWARKLNQA